MPAKADPTKRTEVKCDFCGVVFIKWITRVGKQNWCNRECWTSGKAEIRASKLKTCAACHVEFYPKNSAVSCCSAKCGTVMSANTFREKVKSGEIEVKSGEDSPSWKGGIRASRRRRVLAGKEREYSAEYRKRNPDFAREHSARRRERKGGRLPNGTIAKIGGLQKWRCAICLCDIKSKYHADHIKPLKLGGAHEPANIQLLCPHCNLRKQAKDPIEHMQSLGMLL